MFRSIAWYACRAPTYYSAPKGASTQLYCLISPSGAQSCEPQIFEALRIISATFRKHCSICNIFLNFSDICNTLKIRNYTFALFYRFCSIRDLPLKPLRHLETPFFNSATFATIVESQHCNNFFFENLSNILNTPKVFIISATYGITALFSKHCPI